MWTEEIKLDRLRKERLARVKWLLRWMPRRATVHRYPVLKWFSHGIRKRSYLWSFRCKQAIPAIYSGMIICLLPLFGIQILLALVFALMLRANLPILVGLQFLTNPFTVIPMCYATYNTGRLCLYLFGHETSVLSLNEIRLIWQSITAGHWPLSPQFVLNVFLVTSLGAVILGLFFATLGAGIYRFSAMEIEITRNRLKELKQKRLDQAASTSNTTQDMEGVVKEKL